MSDVPRYRRCLTTTGTRFARRRTSAQPESEGVCEHRAHPWKGAYEMPSSFNSAAARSSQAAQQRTQQRMQQQQRQRFTKNNRKRTAAQIDGMMANKRAQKILQQHGASTDTPHAVNPVRSRMTNGRRKWWTLWLIR